MPTVPVAKMKGSNSTLSQFPEFFLAPSVTLPYELSMYAAAAGRNEDIK